MRRRVTTPAAEFFLAFTLLSVCCDACDICDGTRGQRSLADGSIDEVVIFRETGRCIAAGVWDVWLEPQDANGIPGPVSGPFSITVS